MRSTLGVTWSLIPAREDGDVELVRSHGGWCPWCRIAVDLLLKWSNFFGFWGFLSKLLRTRGGTKSSIFLNIGDTFDPQVILGVALCIKNNFFF